MTRAHLKSRSASLTTICILLPLLVTCGEGTTEPAQVATRLAFSAQPSDATSGSSVASVLVAVQDAQGIMVTTSSATITVAITAGTGGSGAVLGGTVSQTAVNGIATFTNLTIDQAASGYTLTASSNGLAGATSSAFTVTPGPPAKVVFVNQPTAATAGTAITPALQLAIQDAQGNAISTSTAGVSIAITSGTGGAGAALGGTLTQAAVSGVATFSNLTITQAASGYTLTATSPSLTAATSGSFVVSPGAASQVVMVVQPTTATAATAISPGVQVAVHDAFGNLVTASTASVSIAITSGTGASGAILGGTLSQTAVNGVATFANLTIDRAANGYTLTASSSGLTAATSTAITVAPGPPAELVFVNQPTDATAGSALTPALQLAVQDAQGNAVSASPPDVTIAITNGTGDATATLGGTLIRTPASGVATFDDLTITKAATGYTLTATSPSLTPATSGSFAIAPGAASQLVVIVQPTTTTAGTSITPGVQVGIRDAFGNLVTTSAADVAIAITGGTGEPGANLSGVLTQSPSPGSGIATFANLSIDKAGTGYTLTAASSGLSTAISSAFGINAGAASVLAFTVQPTSAPQGTAISPDLQVVIRDASGNLVAATNDVTLSITSGTGAGGAVLGGLLTRAANGGTSTFGGITIDRPGSGYSLTAAATGLTSATSTTFSVAGGTISGTVSLSSSLLSVVSVVSDATATASVNRPIAGVPVPSQDQVEFVPDELVITYNPARLPVVRPSARLMTVANLRGVHAELLRRAQQTAARHRARVLGMSPASLTVRLQVSEPGMLASIQNAIAAEPGVQTVERNAVIRTAIAPTVAPNDASYANQMWHYKAIELEHAWAITTGSNSVLVAVVDDGIRFDHPDIAPNLTADGYDFVSSQIANFCGGGTVNLSGDGSGPDPDPTIPALFTFNAGSNCYSSNTGLGGHGLHVAGTIGAAGNNGTGVSGVNWSVRIRPVRVLNSGGSGTSYDVAQGILYAAGLPADDGQGGQVQTQEPARIISLSLGSPAQSTDVANAVALASANGSLLIAAAGNSNVSTPFYPAGYSAVVSVAAVGPDLERSSYSNFGPTIDIAAPGGDTADGNSTYAVYSTRWDFGTASPAYQAIQGTSMAAPHVSGVAALILAQNPSLTAAQLRSRLEAYAVDLGPAGRDDTFGFGLLNARNSLTQTTSRTRSIRVRLFSDASGAAVADATATAGSYSFSDVVAGSYWVFAGEDEDGDGIIGLADRRWGAFGGTARPTTVMISGAQAQNVSFTVGFPSELEANNTLADADVLPLGGYLFGFASSTDADYAAVRIPMSGQYTFETQALFGACGFALELDTILDLYDSAGTLIASNDDINLGALQQCSRITLTLAPGLYYLRTTGDGTSKRYFVSARVGT